MSWVFGNKHKCNIIYVRNKTTVFPAPKFPMKLTNAEQHHVHYFSPIWSNTATRRLKTGIRFEK